MPKQTESQMVDKMEIRAIVQQEIKVCFEEISSDVKDIKKALLGNDYNRTGLVATVQSHNDYIEKNKITDIANRGLKVVEMFEDWKDNGNWEILNKMILDNVITTRMKVFFGLGSWAGIIAFASSIILVIGWFNGWFGK